MKVRFCGDCGRLILADFLFCPYCGARLAPAGPPLDEALAAPFSKLEARGRVAAVDPRLPREDPAARGIAEAARRLEDLEAEMEALIAQAEASRRD